MYNYSVSEWIAFFAVYCFIGWLFESIYVSIEYRKPVDRGFLYGPVLPIYGFGSIIILMVSLPFKDNSFLIFISGMIGATALEYLTGYAMEKLFGVRYWDYTYEPFNINGYVCLGCSLMWGLLSVVVTGYLHDPVSRFILSFDDNLLVILDVSFLIGMAVDTYASAKAAFDLKKLLREYVENSDYIKKMQKRMDILYAFAEDDYKALHESIDKRKEEYEEERERLREKLEEARVRFETQKQKNYIRAKHVLKRNPSLTSLQHNFELDKLKKIFINSNK